MKLNAARLFVRDLAKAKQFYAHVLQLPVKADGEQYGYVVFSTGTVDLVVESVPQDAPADERMLVGRFSGLSFAVDDIHAAYQRLGAAHVQFTGMPEEQVWGGWLATFCDSDGNQLQLVQLP
jgi:predicted enzyme related to lactoylglutathione lyase